MYRTPSPPDAPAAPTEFVYQGKALRRAPAQLVMQVFLLPLFVGGIASAFAGPAAGVAGLLGSGAVLYFFGRAGVSRKVVRVERGEVGLYEGKSTKPTLRVPLAELADVELDTKTIEHAVEGDSAIPAMRLIEMKGLEVDVTRIALVTADGTRHFLSEDRLGHTETTEAFGKLRVFLRKHGWLPQSERESPASQA